MSDILTEKEMRKLAKKEIETFFPHLNPSDEAIDIYLLGYNKAKIDVSGLFVKAYLNGSNS